MTVWCFAPSRAAKCVGFWSPGVCPACTEGTTGTCIDIGNSGRCFPFFAGTFTCPPGTVSCAPCPECKSGEGPCRHNTDGRCTSFVLGSSVCPLGFSKCAGAATAQVSTATCPPTTCVAGTSGPCEAHTHACWAFASGTMSCPADTRQCAGAAAEKMLGRTAVIADVRIVGLSAAEVHNNDALVLALAKAVPLRHTSNVVSVHTCGQDVVGAVVDPAAAGAAAACPPTGASCINVGFAVAKSADEAGDDATFQAAVDAALASGALASALREQVGAVTTPCLALNQELSSLESLVGAGAVKPVGGASAWDQGPGNFPYLLLVLAAVLVVVTGLAVVGVLMWRSQSGEDEAEGKPSNKAVAAVKSALPAYFASPRSPAGPPPPDTPWVPGLRAGGQDDAKAADPYTSVSALRMRPVLGVVRGLSALSPSSAASVAPESSLGASSPIWRPSHSARSIEGSLTGVTPGSNSGFLSSSRAHSVRDVPSAHHVALTPLGSRRPPPIVATPATSDFGAGRDGVAELRVSVTPVAAIRSPSFRSPLHMAQLADPEPQSPFAPDGAGYGSPERQPQRDAASMSTHGSRVSHGWASHEELETGTGSVAASEDITDDDSLVSAGQDQTRHATPVQRML